jgi:hypothetical protein
VPHRGRAARAPIADPIQPPSSFTESVKTFNDHTATSYELKGHPDMIIYASHPAQSYRPGRDSHGRS